MFKRIAVLISLLFILQGCGSSSSSTSNEGIDNNIKVIQGRKLEFSLPGEELKFNEFKAETLDQETHILYPFTMQTASKFRILSKQFWYDCKEPQDARCSGYLKIQILDADTKQVIYTDLVAEYSYALTPGRSYILKIDVSYSDTRQANYALGFSVWQGQEENVIPRTVCSSEKGEVQFSSRGIFVINSKKSTAYFDATHACGNKVSGFRYHYFYQAGPNGSLEGTTFGLSNLKSLEDSHGEFYTAYPAKDLKGARQLSCWYSTADVEDSKLLNALKLESCTHKAVQL